MRWIRVNVDWDYSSWLFVLSAEAQLAWIKLLCHVKRDGFRGSCKAISTVVAAKQWGIGEEHISKMIEAARNADALSLADGHWTVVNWAKYQETDTTAKERVTRWRKTHNAKIEPNPVTVGNGVNRCNTVNNCHATETETIVKDGKPSSSGKPDRSAKIELGVSEVVGYLNEVCGRRFTPKSASALRARLRDAGKDLDEHVLLCKLVVDYKFAEWGSDPYWSKYLKPDTLFIPAHWESYTQLAVDWDKAGRRIVPAVKHGKSSASSLQDKFATLMGGSE